MEAATGGSSSLAPISGGTVPNVVVGQGNTIVGGTIIGGDHNVHINNIYPNAAPSNSSEARRESLTILVISTLLTVRTCLDALISDITAWFNLKSNSRTIHNDVRKNRIPETGDWFIKSKEYQDWKGRKGAVLCGTGMQQTICVLFVYNRYDDLLSLGDIFKGFILQIIQRHQHLADLVEPLYRRHELEKTNPTDDDLLDLLITLESHFDRIYYVVDGVDEVDRERQFDLIQALKRLQGNVIFASRPLEDLRTELENARYLSFLAQDGDLRLLIDERLKRHKALCRILERNHYREEATRQIAEKAAGMDVRRFLHAALQIEALCTCRSLAAVQESLNQFPVGLEGMYAASISRIESQDPKDVWIAKQALLWVVFARTPLSLHDLRAALGAHPETFSIQESRMPDEESIIDLCCGLLEVHSESDIVRLVHFTAKDALEPLLLRDFPQPHLFISQVLVQRMVDTNLVCWDSTDEYAFDQFKMRHPLLDYSYDHWHTHILECGDSPEALDCAMTFLRQCTAFPASVDHYWWHIGLLQPLHVAARYGLTFYLDSTFDNDRDAFNARTSPQATQSDASTQHAHAAPINATTEEGDTALLIASVFGHLDFVKRILRMPDIDINVRRERNGETALHCASGSGCTEMVRALLQVPGIDANAANQRGETALMLPSKYGHDLVVSQLLQVPGIDANAADEGGRTALMFASERGHDGVVSQLVQVPGIDANAADGGGKTALMFASEKGHDGVVSQLLQVPGIDANAADEGGWTALMLASLSRPPCDGVVRQLLQVPGIDANAANQRGETALMLASKYGHDLVVSQLVQVPGIDANAANQRGETALMLVSEVGCDRVVSQLVQVPGIDANAADGGGKTALMLASRNCCAGVVSQLVQVPGIDANAADEGGRTALMLASRWGYDGVVSQLLQAPNVNIDSVDTDDWTVLMHAACYGLDRVTSHLISIPGVNVNAANTFGWTPLMIASFWGHDRVVDQLLLARGVNVDAVNNEGWTALMAASFYGHTTVVKKLLQVREANVNIHNIRNSTPLTLASEKGHADIVQLLLEHGADVTKAW
ncbi:ankyrin repeat domain-containing protein 50 [Coprinopsis cinerea okayama7|uniref:Ankyrin repeat domain-containing protein 50 n=1 Tax=Coprinopsis cinerea (strain Okayama-7 / 130 / ATCC MYA-4618 / FGSC 9003) TaxID=240176 RepID=A8P154_COPC7|nr:ankyrin repeat domain-containing protein 50 [Coprinopsis cinerea okayama7\|eukprot:XP_001838027.2 ankyrin repeat domain-containing protein 50 [Coprinopsis cinerea okayama7\